MKFSPATLEIEEVLRFEKVIGSQAYYIGRAKKRTKTGETRYEFYIWDPIREGFSPEPNTYWSAHGVLSMLKVAGGLSNPRVHYNSVLTFWKCLAMLKELSQEN